VRPQEGTAQRCWAMCRRRGKQPAGTLVGNILTSTSSLQAFGRFSEWIIAEKLRHKSRWPRRKVPCCNCHVSLVHLLVCSGVCSGPRARFTRMHACYMTCAASVTSCAQYECSHWLGKTETITVCRRHSEPSCDRGKSTCRLHKCERVQKLAHKLHVLPELPARPPTWLHMTCSRSPRPLSPARAAWPTKVSG
jgi:hypothetical protein